MRFVTVCKLGCLGVVLMAGCGGEERGERSEEAAPGENEPSRTRSVRSDRAEGGGLRQRLNDEFETAQAMPAGDERNQALAALFLEALEPAPDLAEKALRELPVDAEVRSDLVHQFITSLVAEGKTREAMGWAESLYSAEQRRQARSQISALLMETNPQEAMQLLSAEDLAAEGVHSASGAVLQMWTSKEPDKAVVWASRLPDGETREEGFRAVFSAWAGNDGEEALGWIGTQTNPHVREDALAGAARAFKDHPEPIMDALFGEADPELRAELERKIDELNAAEAVPPEEE